MNNKFYEQVLKHHNIVQEKIAPSGEIVLITVAVGSQNYGLDTPESDCDTFSFILPDFMSFIRGDAPKSYEFEVDDGKCCVKDLRLALNLLRKPSPNSVECWVSPYRVYNENYKEVFEIFLGIDDNLFFMTHCNYRNMLDATAGTCKGLHGRNMPLGKKVAHTLRLRSMMQLYIEGEVTSSEYLKMPDDILAAARLFKEHSEQIGEENLKQVYDTACKWFNDLKEKFEYNSTIRKVEETGEIIVNNFQASLMDIYFKENGYRRVK